MKTRKRILVVDDDHITRDLICFKLREGGYDVDTASHCLEALVSMKENKPDLVLLDIMMPGLSGLEVLNLIRAEHVVEKLPVIIISQSADDEMILAAEKLGADGYLVKPFEMEILIDKLKTISGFA